MTGKKSQPIQHNLSRRERQIMDAVFRKGKVTAVEIHGDIPDPPSQDAIRRLIRILEEKGFLSHEVDGPRHVYYPTIDPERASRSALDHVVTTYFKGSVSQAITALIESSPGGLSPQELSELIDLIKEAGKEGR